MAAMSRLLPMMAFSTFAIFLLALLATPTNALSNEPHAHVARGHDSIAKRRRNPAKRAKRCRPKSTGPTTSSLVPSEPSKPTDPPATTPAPTSTRAPASTSHAQTTSAAPAPAPPSSGGGAGLDPNKKLLLAWANGPDDLPKWAGGKNVGGVYSWSPFDPTGKSSVPFFPMVWGTKQKSSFQQQVKNDNHKLCLGPNEPNEGSQSNMSPESAAQLWRETLEPQRAQGNCKLVSAATTSAPNGITWLQNFIKACPDCHVDYVALHWYGTDTNEFKKYVTNFYNTFKKPIIVSEYACQSFTDAPQCSKQQTLNMHYEMAKWFQQTPWIAMFAPFGAMREMQGVNPDNQLMNDNGTPNDLGNFYLYADF